MSRHDTKSSIALVNVGCAALMAMAVMSTGAMANPKVQIGVLHCEVDGGTGFVFGSTKRLRCVFQRPGPSEHYVGSISKYGIDIGQTSQSVIEWAVLAPGKNIPFGALAGTYVGVSGEATIGVGLGANALLGGFNKSIALQPLSVQAQQGLNLAAGIAELNLSTR